MTAAEVREKLEPLYRKLFGTIFGDAIIHQDVRLRRLAGWLDPDDVEPLWDGIEEALGFKLTEDTKLYIWSASFGDVLQQLSFISNRNAT